MLSWCITQSAFGVGHVWACSKSVAARDMPQKHVTVGAPRGRRGRPRRRRIAARKSASGRVRVWAAGRASSQAEASPCALRRASEICPSGLLLSKLCRSCSKLAWAQLKAKVCWAEVRTLLVSSTLDRSCVFGFQSSGAAVHAACWRASSATRWGRQRAGAW
jgi:hypothetical protein